MMAPLGEQQQHALLCTPPTYWPLDQVFLLFSRAIRLRVEDPALAFALADQLTPARTDKAPTSTIDLLTVPEAGYQLVHDEIPGPLVTRTLRARSEIISALLRGNLMLPPWRAMLHGSCVSRHDRSLLLAGQGGSGKSTLTAALLQEDWRYLADDITILDGPSLVPVPVPFAISVKSGSWPVLAQIYPRLMRQHEHVLGRRRIRYLSVPQSEESSAAPIAIICPEYSAGCEPSLLTLDPLTVLDRLFSPESWVDVTPTSLTAFLAWIGQTPAYALRYPTTQVAINVIESLPGFGCN